MLFRSLRSSIFGIIDIQFGDIYRYDIRLTADDSEPEELAQLQALMETSDAVASAAAIHTRSVTFSSGDTSVDGYVTVTDDPSALCRQIDMRQMEDKAPLQIPEDGVLIDIKLAEMLGLQEGDTITIDCGTMVTVPIRAIAEHYVYHYAYMTADTYESLTGERPAPNEYLITTLHHDSASVSSLCEELLEQPCVQSVTNLPAMAKTFRETIDAVDAAVFIIIFSAAALALVVLYNLTNINITERLRELATIKVLGFYDREVAMYVYRENLVLTLLGIALGQFFGRYLCTWLIHTIEMDIVMFGRDPKPVNHLLSIILSLFFAVLVNILMFFRLRKIDMVQSLKSVE